MKKVQILSDYTSEDEPNFIQLIQDEQGDIHINLFKYSNTERGVRIAASGTRHSNKVREEIYNLIKVIEEESK
jgi:hypothetical protein